MRVLFVITNINGTYGDAYSFGLASIASVAREKGWEYDYAVIHFNNGLHSLNTDRAAWETALRDVINVLKEKGKGAKLVCATATPLKDPALTAKAKELNAIAVRVMKENGIPVNDLFGLMDPQDRSMWSDTFHYHEPARKMQAKQVADAVRKLLPPPPPAPAAQPQTK